uniref:Uncharacterized protein n=1 Tax=uncultured bacterium esnapd15 TaxID=1366595 RepID=S5UCX0_9BACT|nr:hypothetical protein [uncultured bacterium esnapd15]
MGTKRFFAAGADMVVRPFNRLERRDHVHIAIMEFLYGADRERGA